MISLSVLVKSEMRMPEAGIWIQFPYSFSHAGNHFAIETSIPTQKENKIAASRIYFNLLEIKCTR